MQLARNSVSSVTSFSLTPIPLFVLMGEVLFHTGLAVKVIDGIERLIRAGAGAARGRRGRRRHGVLGDLGLDHRDHRDARLADGAGDARARLPPDLATGPVMAIGAVDMLIPPSALTVLLGSLSGISISKLLIGGVVPGLVLALAFVAWIVVRVQA